MFELYKPQPAKRVLYWVFVNNVQLAQAFIDTVHVVIPLVSKLQSCTQMMTGCNGYVLH